MDNDSRGLLEFLVHRIERQKGSARVVGRNGFYAIKVADIFELAYLNRVSIGEDEVVSEPPLVTYPVSLRVEGIKAYGHQLDELDPGTTAELTLSGEGREELGLMLGGEGRLELDDGVMLVKRLDEVAERRRRMKSKR